MKNRLLFNWVAGATVVIGASLPQASALDRVENTLLDFAFNAPEDFNFEMNRQMIRQPSFGTDFYGETFQGRATGESTYFHDFAVSVDFNLSFFDSKRTQDYKGKGYSPILSARVKTVQDIDVGLIYSPGYVDFSSYESRVTGDGMSQRVGIFLGKQFDPGLKVGASYVYGSDDIDAKDRVFATTGHLGSDRNGVSVSGGYAHQFGQDRPGWNLAVDTTGNLLYSTQDSHYNPYFNGPLPVKKFNDEVLWFAWRNAISHGLSKTFAVYGTFDLNYRLSEKDQSGNETFFGTALPKRTQAFGEVGGGVAAQLGRGFCADAGARVSVFNSAYRNLTLGLGLHYNF